MENESKQLINPSDLKQRLSKLQDRLLALGGGIFDLEQKGARLSEPEKLASEPDFWNAPEKAQGLLKERAQLTDIIERASALDSAVEDL